MSDALLEAAERIHTLGKRQAKIEGELQSRHHDAIALLNQLGRRAAIVGKYVVVLIEQDGEESVYVSELAELQ